MTAVEEIKTSLSGLSLSQQNAVFGANARALFQI